MAVTGLEIRSRTAYMEELSDGVVSKILEANPTALYGL